MALRQSDIAPKLLGRNIAPGPDGERDRPSAGTDSSAAPKIAIIRLEFNVHPGNPG